MTPELKIVFFGTPEFVVPVARSLKAHFNLVGIVTTPDTIQGRKKELMPSPLKVFGELNDIPVLTPESYDSETLAQLTNLKPDLFVVAAYGVIVPQSVLNIPKNGSLNIHPSLLPKYRGPSPIQAALLNGDEVSGVTIIEMDADVDHGPIVAQWKISLQPDDTFEKLHFSMFADAAEKLPTTIAHYIDGTIKPIPQDDSQATYTKHITKQDGFIDITNINTLSELEIRNLKLEIARKARAYYPWPNAWTRLSVNSKPQIVKFFPDKKIQMEGKNIVTIKEFLNGYPELREKIQKIFGEE